jgi:glyoxylase-like metal-dependent hydrolase (beta-lactamase superfamily II)
MLKQLSDRVWIDPPGRWGEIRPAVGVLRTTTQTVLVDPGNSPTHARRLQADLTRLGLPPVTLAIYTHHHWDHVFGACVFGVPVLAHALCRDLLARQAGCPLGEHFVAAEMERDARLRPSYTALLQAMKGAWGSFHIVVPTLTFENEHTVRVDDLELRLRHVGGAHAPDSIVVEVPQERVTFIGDCYYGAPAASGRAASLRDSAGMLLGLLEESDTTYVDGHTFPLRRRVWLTALLRLMKAVPN